MPATIELALFAVYHRFYYWHRAGRHLRRKAEQPHWTGFARWAGLAGISLPRFWLGLMLIISFAVNMGMSAGIRAV